MGVLNSQIANEQLNLVPGHVLIVEHSDTFTDVFLNGLDCLTRQLTRAENVTEAMGKITAQSPDVILVSHQLTGLDFLDQLRASGDWVHRTASGEESDGCHQASRRLRVVRGAARHGVNSG